MPLVLLIPAYRPGPALPRLVERMAGGPFAAVVVVDDGSGGEYAAVFEACRATVLRHERNRGKGAALKTGIAYARERFPGCGVVTADADGQHLAEDVLRVAARMAAEGEGSLVLGARAFDSGAPLRSRVGNRMARGLVRLLIGRKITDTQTGLRGIPAGLTGVLTGIRADGYEFELDMLQAAVEHGLPIEEERITTVYEPGNPTSHFRPFLDSLKIGFVLARFSLLSLATACLDNAVFFVATKGGLAVAVAQVLARMASVMFNYPLARSAVFHSARPHGTTLTRYLLLVAGSGFVSYRVLSYLHEALGWPVLAAKLTAETALFLINFAVQRDLIFSSRRRRG